MKPPTKFHTVFGIERTVYPGASLTNIEVVNPTTLTRWRRNGLIAGKGHTWVLTSTGAELLGWTPALPKLSWWQRILRFFGVR